MLEPEQVNVLTGGVLKARWRYELDRSTARRLGLRGAFKYMGPLNQQETT